MTYNPSLDGLRALAAFAVVAFHVGAPFAGGGFLGVDVFFVLSGYLITRLLLAEREATGSIRLARFYWRRALRLYPTLLAMLAAFVTIGPLLWPDLPHWRYAMWSALYLSDYSRALLGEPIVLSYTWSLSVEEHYYLLWPLLLPLVLRAGSPIKLLAVAYVAATAWRIANFYWLGWDPTYFRFDTRLSGLILGCMLALWNPDLRRYLLLAMASLILVSVIPAFHHAQGLTTSMLVAEWSAAVIVMACMQAGGRLPVLSAGPLPYLGRLSYGIYVWHFPIAYLVRDVWPWHLSFTAVTLFSVVMAAVTYHGLDVPMRRFRAASTCKDAHQEDCPAGPSATRDSLPTSGGR